MCNFCNEEATHSITLLDQTYNTCSACFNNLKLCDLCNSLGVFGKTVTYGGTQFTCTQCADNLKNCTKCGNLHANEELCNHCLKSWFKCTDCGKWKTKVRSQITNRQVLEYALPTDLLCKKCLKENHAHKPKLTVQHCFECNELHTNEGRFCTTCAVNAFTCEHCKGEYVKQKIHLEKAYCYMCFENLIQNCIYCRTQHFKTDLIKGICSVCQPFIQECNHCGALAKLNDPIDGIELCNSCTIHRVHDCKLCGKPHYDIVDNICPDCRYEFGVDEIRNYTTKMPIKLKGKSFQPHYGIENELAMKAELYKELGITFLAKNYHGRDVIYKNDASVINGFECVFRPMTLTEIHQFSYVFNNRLFRNHDSCGMHIHINKSAFTTYHLYKFCNFLLKNHEWLELIAERKLNTYCRLNNERPTKIAKCKDTNDRDMINLRNKTTIELRMFAGVTNSARLIKNVEFVDALYYWTKNNNTETATNQSKFVEWVMQQKYPRLKAFLKEI